MLVIYLHFFTHVVGKVLIYTTETGEQLKQVKQLNNHVNITSVYGNGIYCFQKSQIYYVSYSPIRRNYTAHFK